MPNDSLKYFCNFHQFQPSRRDERIPNGPMRVQIICAEFPTDELVFDRQGTVVLEASGELKRKFDKFCGLNYNWQLDDN